MRFLLFILFTCICTVLVAQEITLMHLSNVNGLPDNNVTSVVQDSRGFMWFGTNEGLSRFDGTSFRNYGHQKGDSVPLTGFIFDMYENKPGHLIFFSNYRLLAINSYQHALYRPLAFANRYITSIRKVNDERYLIGGFDSCFVVDANMQIEDVLIPPIKKSNLEVHAFPLDENIFLVGGYRNYFLYNVQSKTFNFFDLGLDSIPPNNHLAFKYYDPVHQWFYFAHPYTGLHRYSKEGKRLKTWPVNAAGRVVPINDSLSWIGEAEKFGSRLINLLSDRITALVVRDKVNYNAYTLQADNEGNHWLGSSEGLTKIQFKNRFIRRWNTFGGEPPHNFPLNIVKGKDQNMYLSMYIVPYLYRLNKKTNAWELISKNINTGPWCMNAVGDEIIFTGGQTTRFTTYNPIADKLAISSDFLKPYFPKSDIVILAFQHSNGDRWYSGNKGGGLVRISASNGKIHHYTKDSHPEIFTWSYYVNYAEDTNGDLYFGVNKSWLPIHWSKKEDNFSVVRYDTMPGGRGKVFRGINKLVTDKEDNVWIGFDGTGLVKYNSDSTNIVHYTIEDGLPSNFVTNLAFDSKGRLWIATTNGLGCLLVNENSFRTFTLEEGLADDQFPEGCLYYDSATNELWAGASTAITAFNTDSLLLKSRQPIKVYVDEILINSSRYTYEPGMHLQLSSTENNVLFRFVGVHNNRKKIEYSYQLSGQDDEWIESPANTSASYANLAPGDYVFSVRANYKGDHELFIIDSPVYFTIATPWFKTWWFNAAAFVAGVFSVILVVRFYYSRKTEKQRIVLEKQQAVEKERTRIATDMHDDFGASLSRIKFISEKMKLKESHDSPIGHDLQKISGYSDEMAEKMNEIVWALNERYDTLEDLVSFSRAYAADYLAQHNLVLNFHAEIVDNRPINGEVRRNIFLVLKESLRNIVKHAQATRVDITFHQNRVLEVTVRDNGKGFEPQGTRAFSNGLHNMQKRVEDIGGGFELKSEKGTVIQIKVSL